MTEYDLNPLVDIIIQHMKLGALHAEINWLKCSDLNNTSKAFKNLKRRVNFINTTISKKFKNLDVFLNNTEIQELRNFCKSSQDEYLEKHEIHFEISNRPPNLFFDKTAIINITNEQIPEDILMGLSFGNKFIYPFNINGDNMKRILALMEYTIEGCVPPALQEHATKEVYGTLKNIKDRIFDPKTIWLNFVKHRTQNFFNQHKELAAIKSDKGNHTVIITIDEYKQKMYEHLQNDVYSPIIKDPINKLVKEESELLAILNTNTKIAPICKALEPETLNLAQMYGVIKIHKDFKIRPITSTTGAPGHNISRTMNILTEKIFPRGQPHLKDSYTFKMQIDQITPKPDDVMVSMDVVSMYTSIPSELVIRSIMQRASNFKTQFDLEKRTLARILNFILRKCPIFMFDGKIYAQKYGLPMGGVLSALSARIIMDEIMKYFHDNALFEPTYIGIYVDDSIFIMNKAHTQQALNILNNFLPNKIQFTMENEHNNKINFLNLTLQRTDNKIETDWHMKNYASNRLLNYYSSHKSSIIIGTAKHFIKTVLLLSDPSLFTQNKARVTNRLKLNNFPEDLISVLMNSTYTFFKPLNKPTGPGHNFYTIPEKYKHIFDNLEDEEKDQGEDKSYISFPHAIYKNKQIKRILYHYKEPNIVLADSIRNTKINFVRNLKTPIPIERRKNLIAMSRCICGQRVKIDRTTFNQTGGTLKKKILNQLQNCTNDFHAHKKLTFIRGLAFNNQTQFYLKYLRWINRTKIRDGKLDWPNKYLTKLIKDKPM